MGKRMLVAIMALVIIGGTDAVGVAAQPDPATVYRQFIDAINRGDLSAIGALVTDDALLVVADCQLCVGRQAKEEPRDLVAPEIASLAKERKRSTP